MKTQLQYILLTTCMALAAPAASAYAQDTNITEFEVVDTERDKAERDKILYSPGEGDTKYIPRNPTTPTQPTGKEKETKESTKETEAKTIAPVIKTKQDHSTKSVEKTAQTKPTDDDTILSFNFLYFIIQKYKLQDIID